MLLRDLVNVGEGGGGEERVWLERVWLDRIREKAGSVC